MAQVIYSTVRTSGSVLKDVRRSLMDGESVRFWEERSGGWWSSESHFLWRVYAATFAESKANARLSKSRTYSLISREEFEDAVELPVARNLWMKMQITGSATEPRLIIMAGVPLSGKTTLAREMVRRALEPTVLIENDAVREHIVSEMKLAAPKYTVAEHRKVYNVSWELIRLALSRRCHVVFDATNLTESGRAGAYEAAMEYGAQVLVIFVKASGETLHARYMAVDKERQKAFKKLGSKTDDHKKCSETYVLVESDKPAEELLREIADDIKIPIKDV